MCCENTKYCIINSTSLAVECCALGSTCGGPCSPDAYFSLSTTTQTTSGATSTATLEVCAARACTSTHYLCPSSMGGGCCAYGQDCLSGGQCLAPSTASSSSGPAVATMIPSGCSRQGDTTCASDGRCCGAGYACTTVSSQPMCAETSPSSATSSGPAPTGPGISVVPPSRGLSTGARAGIAVGVVVAAALAIGAATWLCIRRRRSSGRSTTTGNELGSNVGAGGGMTRLAAAGRHESDDGGLRAYGPSSGPHMSEADVSSSRGGGAGPLGGLANDYFGPAAANGPYTTPDGYLHDAGTGGAGPGADPQDYLARTSVRGDGGTPHGPDDIASAVEMGSGKPSLRRKKGEDGEGGGGGGGGGMVRPRMPSEVGSSHDGGSELDGSDNMVARQQQRQPARQRASSPTVRDSIAGRFELYGTDVTPDGGGGVIDRRAPRPLGTPGSEMSASELGTPSPMSHEEQQQQQQQQQRSGRKAAG